jgi:acyl-CoA thioesterase YciA
MTPKPPSDTPAIRLIMMPKDTNAQGTIFGGTILSLIDQAAFVEAWRHKNHRYVTVAMDAVEFHEPVHVGDILSLWAQVTRIGRTSLRVHVEVRALRRDSDCETRVTQADVTLVAIDGAGRPTPVQDAASEGVPDNRLP